MPDGDGVDVAVAEGRLPVESDPFVAGLQRETRRRDQLLAWVREALTPGVDWLLIHAKVGGNDCPQAGEVNLPSCAHCHRKATLAKPGSEKIAGVLHLRPRFRRDHETWEMLGRMDGLICLVCELVNAQGEIVAEGRGARSLSQDRGIANTTVKMAEKSAQIDAVLRCAGLSEVFTQDLDDLQAAAGNPAAQFQRPQRRDVPVRAPSDDVPPSPEELAQAFGGTIVAPDAPPPAAPAATTQLGSQLRKSIEQIAARKAESDRVGTVDGAINEKQVKLIYGKLRTLSRRNGPDPDDAKFERLKAALKVKLADVLGVEHIEHIPRGKMDTVIGWLVEAELKGAQVRA